MRDLKDILSSGAASLEALVKEAFDAGVAHGKAVAAKELQAKISAVLSVGDHAETLLIRGGGKLDVGSTSIDSRAAPGTVKPEIMRLIASKPYELTTDD
jgi:hypothetical protein